MSVVAERLEGRIDATGANKVHWGTRSAMVTTVSQFWELDADLEVLESGHNAGFTVDEVDALWSQVRTAVDLLAPHVPPSVARNPPGSTGE
jgi:hypothetical protein